VRKIVAGHQILAVNEIKHKVPIQSEKPLKKLQHATSFGRHFAQNIEHLTIKKT